MLAAEAVLHGATVVVNDDRGRYDDEQAKQKAGGRATGGASAVVNLKR